MISVRDAINKTLSRDSDYISDVVMGRKLWYALAFL